MVGLRLNNRLLIVLESMQLRAYFRSMNVTFSLCFFFFIFLGQIFEKRTISLFHPQGNMYYFSLKYKISQNFFRCRNLLPLFLISSIR